MNKHAVLLGSLGGKARAKKLTSARRKEIARMGGLAKKKAPVDNSFDLSLSKD